MKLKQLILAQLSHKQKRTRAESLIILSKYPKPKTKSQLQLEKIQCILDNQNKKQNPQMDTHQQIIPGFQKHVLQNKLWKYFMSKLHNIDDKVQKEKVNIWGSEMGVIVRSAKKKINIKKETIQNLKKTIMEKYAKSHEAYQQIFQTKTERSENRLKQNYNKKSQEGFKQKIKLLKQKMIQLRKEAEQREKEVKKTELDLEILKQQLQSFVKLLLKNGFYKEDGMFWVLRQLVQLNYRPNKQDLPDCLDNGSKQCLLHEYENIKHSEKVSLDCVDKLPFIKNKMLRSNSTDTNISKMNTKKVYTEARNFIEQKLRQNEWNCPTQPNRFSIAKSPELFKWRELQKKRIAWAYKNQDGVKAIRILFGTKVDMLQIMNENK